MIVAYRRRRMPSPAKMASIARADEGSGIADVMVTPTVCVVVLWNILPS